MADIVPTQVFHARTHPRKNTFEYGAYYLALSLENIENQRGQMLFSINRFNLFSFHTSDHADGKTPLKKWIHGVLRDWEVSEADGDVLLLTLPRVLGYAFNPVSFWFCYDKEKNIRAVLAEVNNTFGERHCYLCFHEDRRPIGPSDTLHAQKVFHVSPFIKVQGNYSVRFAVDETKLAAKIDLHDENGLVLTTGMVGERKALTAGRILYYFFRYPLVTLKVVGLIHYQAVKLFLKGVKHEPKPPPPIAEITR